MIKVVKFIPSEKFKKKNILNNTDDSEIYVILSKIDDIENVKSYYELNKEAVNDRKIFHQMAQERIHILKNNMLSQKLIQ